MSSNLAIRVDGLGKKYRIGGLRQVTRGNFREFVTDAVTGPIRRASNLLRGQAYGAAEMTETIWALKDVSFEIYEGEVVGIIGANGAGKSTLLKVLSRITEPSTGYVDLWGRVGALLEVGTGFHAELTGRENIYLNGAILGMKRAEIDRKFDEIIDFSGVEKFIDTPVKFYSSGMSLRLGFAVAAHLEPDILIVDEVLAVGDAQFQRKCLGKMESVAGEGRTVLFVSHNMNAITTLTQKSILLNEGKITEIGPTPQVVDAYLSRVQESGAAEGQEYLDLTPRQLDTAGHLRFTHIQICDEHGNQIGAVSEMQPFTIRLGVEVENPVENLQLVCSVRDFNLNSALFTVVSDNFHDSLAPGHYTTAFTIRPNYLREGVYNFVLRAFVDGVRRDHIAPALQLAILPNTDNATLNRHWMTGPFRFDYPWNQLEQIESKRHVT